MLSFREFSMCNRNRCENQTGFNHKLDSWSTSDKIGSTIKIL